MRFDPRVVSGAGRFIPWGLVAGIGLGLLAAAVVVVTGFDPPDADVKKDWLVTRAAWSANAYDPLLELAKAENVEVVVHGSPDAGPAVHHPRTPGALLLMSPLGLLPFRALVATWTGVAVAFLVPLIWLALAPLRSQWWKKLLVAAALAVSAPTLVTLRFSAQASLVATLVFVALWMSSRSPRVAGTALAIAGTLKVFPLLLLIPWVATRRRTVVWALGVVAALNVAGVMLPGVSVASAWRVMASATSEYVIIPVNASVLGVAHALGLAFGASTVLPFVVSAGLVVAVLVARSWRIPMAWVVVGLLVIPLSWVSYDVVLFPAVASMAVTGVGRRHAAVALTVWVLMGVGVLLGAPGLGLYAFAVRLVVLAALGHLGLTAYEGNLDRIGLGCRASRSGGADRWSDSTPRVPN